MATFSGILIGVVAVGRVMLIVQLIGDPHLDLLLLQGVVLVSLASMVGVALREEGALVIVAYGVSLGRLWYHVES